MVQDGGSEVEEKEEVASKAAGGGGMGGGMGENSALGERMACTVLLCGGRRLP